MKKLLLVLISAGTAGSAQAQGLIDNYLSGTPVYTVIANSLNQVSQPRDLDFKPRTNELWIINKGAGNGGSNVIVYNAGQPNQNIQIRMDSHSGHFMIYPSAIAFGHNGEFANTNEIINTANPGSTFMGPALWSSDTNIFARVFQNNWDPAKPLGSHLDMLHQSPLSMGIAHDTASMYWVFDGHNGNLCKYDFGIHHSPGYDDHSNGRVWRYSDVPLTRAANIPGHMIKDQATGWLYIVNAGTQKLIRVNPATATNAGSLAVPASGFEPLQGYWSMTGATVQVLDSFPGSQPCGIDLAEGRLIVGDYTNGNIYVYDITGTAPVKTGTIATGQTGMMGLKIGPDGKIWFVNYTQNTVVRIDPATGVSNDVAVDAITAPGLAPFDTHFYHPGFNQCTGSITPIATIRNSGTNNLTSATLAASLDNGTPQTFSWTGNLAPGATASVTLPALTAVQGAHVLKVEASNPNGAGDANPANNIKAGAFRAMTPASAYPFSENFTGTTFPPAGWTYLGHNPHNPMTHTMAAGKTAPGSIKMDNYSGNVDITGQRDYLISPRIDFSNATATATLSFGLASAQYDATLADQLTVLASTDCGQSWTQVYHKSGAALATVSPTISAFTPNAAGWRTETASLASLAGQPDVILQFRSTSGFSNNLYLDDISVSNTNGITDVQQKPFTVYPNPAKDRLVIQGTGRASEQAQVEMVGVAGNIVRTVKAFHPDKELTIDVSDLASGSYLVRITAGAQKQVEKVTIIR